MNELRIIKFVAAGLTGLNGIPLHMLQKRTKADQTGEQVPTVLLFRLGLSLFVSQVGWWVAIFIGCLDQSREHAREGVACRCPTEFLMGT